MLGYDQRIDKLLNEVEAMLLYLASALKISGGNITRWRWDEPDITLTWKDSGIEKSVHVTVEQTELMGIEINAWKDFDDPGDRRRRQWKNYQFPGQFSLADLPAKLKEAFVTVLGWSEAELVYVAHII